MRFAASFRSLWRGGAQRTAWLVVASALLLALVASAAGAAPTGATRVALVIGNSAYASVGRLANPGNDAKLVARSLKAAGFLLVGGDAQLDLTKARFDAAVAEFGRAIAGADVALFYYSGHGLQVDGTNFLVPVDANPTRAQDLDFQMVSAELVLRQMSGSGTKLNLLILDACRNNPFSGRGLRSANGGLAEMKAPEGTLISYATQPGAVASDGDGRDSPFTLALVDAMRQPGLDIFRLFNRVGLTVKKTTAGQQQPWLSASPIEGEFAFAAPTGTPTPAPAPPAATETVALEPPVSTPPQTRQGPAAGSNAPPTAGFSCPPKGTVVAGQDEVFNWQGEDVSLRAITGNWSWRSLGGDPDNPDLCLHVGSGGTAHRLVGWFDLDQQEFADDPTRPMLALLAGQSSEMVVRSTKKNGSLTILTSTWRAHGHASFPIGGRDYDTLVFDLSERSNRNSFTGSGRCWYAPALGLFVRRMWRSSKSDDVIGWSVTRVAAPTAGKAP